MTSEKHILIIEDDTLMQRVFERQLRLDGYNADVAPLSGDIKAYLKDMTVLPGLIILDIMMPKVNGLEILEFLKHDVRLKEVPVIILTNVAGREAADEALTKGASLYFVKSEHEPEEILKQVKLLLNDQT